jgi:peptide/nickel transport system substrate-binding protein
VAAFAVMLLSVLAACSSSGSSGGGSGSTNAYLRWDPCCTWGTTWSLNYYSPLYIQFPNGLIMLPLAAEDYPSLTSFTPQLATSWTQSGNNLTINLRSGVKWNNGKPVTSTDVYDTLVLDGIAQLGGWTYIAGISAPNPQTVVIAMHPGTNASLLEDELFNRPILPASQYGKFVTSGLEQDDVAYYTAAATNPAAALKLPQYTAMEAAFKTLAAFNPSTITGDGPFTLKAINTAEALMVKWPGFFGASNIHIGGIDYSDDQNQAIYPKLLSGSIDLTNVYLSPAILKEWASTQGSKTALPPGFMFNLMINDHKYPLNITAVRQALAYLIPRANMVAAAYGGSSVADRGANLNTYIDGLPTYLNSLFLTPSQIASLNPYPVNTAKATSLLEGAGFHKSGNTWMMPNGKPFTLTFLVQSQTSDIVASFQSAATALDAFGISANLNSTEGPIVTEDTSNGDFELSMNLTGGPNPLYNDLDQVLGHIVNFETLGNYAGDTGLGFGPTESVPGLGNVNVPATIDQESETVGPGAQMNQLTWDWAQEVNQQVPYITYATKVYQFSFSTHQFTDWPPLGSGGTSQLWNMMGQGDGAVAMSLMLQQGYIRPAG